MPQDAPGTFLAGAGQTAMGIVGGMLLANAIGGMFGGNAEGKDVLSDQESNFKDSDYGDDAGVD